MYRITLNFHNRLLRGELPITYCIIHTDMGYRAYAEKELKGTFQVGGYLADGSSLADGSITAGGGLGLLDTAGRIISSSSFERTISPKGKTAINSLETRQLQHMMVTLDNHDRYFSKLIAKEYFLTKDLSWYIGFEDDPFAEHLKIFNGIISSVNINGSQMVIEADER